MENKIFIPKGKKLLDPKVDSTFKTLFTREGKSARIALKELVRTIIGHGPESVEVINSELPKDIENAKNIRLDLQCKMPDGARIDIEMQTCMSDDDLKARSLYYGCRMMSSAVKSGVTYRKLPDIYQVMFTNFQLFSDDSSYLERFMVQNGRFVLSEHLQYIFIQMPLVKEAGRGAKNLSEIEKWVIFLRDSTDESKRDLLNEIMASNEGIREAGEILMTISDDASNRTISFSPQRTLTSAVRSPISI